MSDILALALAFLAGALLGVFFFGGLWWTVQKGVTSERPALWFLGSLLLRTGMILAGFYFVSQGHWSRVRGVPPWISDRSRHRREAARTSPGRRADSDWKQETSNADLSPDETGFLALRLCRAQ